jgi:hypothetical protein
MVVGPVQNQRVVYGEVVEAIVKALAQTGTHAIERGDELTDGRHAFVDLQLLCPIGAAEHRGQADRDHD